MRASELYLEGASIVGYMKDTVKFNGEPRQVWSFPKGYTDDEEVEGQYFSNASMRQVLGELGLDPDFEEASPIPIDQFINITTQWLKKHIGKQSEPEEPEVTKQPGGPTMVSGGKPEGYFNSAVMSLNQTARKIKEKYPQLTHVSFN